MRLKSFDILLIGLFLFFAWLIGFYFEEFTDIVFTVIFTGQLQTKPGTIFNNYECLFLLAKPIQYLQYISEHVNIYGLFLVLINSFCIYSMLKLFNKIIDGKFSRSIRYLLFTAIFILVFNDYIFIQFTKTAIFCIFLGLYYFLYDPGKIKLAFFFLLFGILLRAEAFWLIGIFTLALHWIHNKQLLFLKLKKNKNLWLTIVILAVGVTILNKKVYTEDDARYSSFRGYKYSILDFKQGDQLSLNTTDSVKLEALQHYFFGDNDSLLTTSTFKRLGIPTHERFSFFSSYHTLFSSHKFKEESEHVLSIYSSYKEFYFLWLAIFFIILVLCFRKSNWMYLKKTGYLLAFTAAYITAITFYIKMEARVLNPLLICLIFYITLFSSESSSSVTSRRHLLLCFILIPLFIYPNVIKLYYKQNGRHKLDRQASYFFNHRNNDDERKILIPDVYSWELFCSKVFNDPSKLKRLKMLSLDDAYMCMMKNHLDYMYTITGSNHFKAYITYILQNKNNVCFIGTEERIQLLEKYVRVVYHTDLTLYKLNASPVIEGYGSIGYLQFYLYGIR